MLAVTSWGSPGAAHAPGHGGTKRFERFVGPAVHAQPGTTVSTPVHAPHTSVGVVDSGAPSDALHDMAAYTTRESCEFAAGASP